jgi:glycosyltransferase involved in cell wall biosynthesis
MEAMASGLAAVATDVGGVGDAIVDGMSLVDLRRRRALARNARADAVRRFDVQRMVDDTLSVYQEEIRMRQGERRT